MAQEGPAVPYPKELTPENTNNTMNIKSGRDILERSSRGRIGFWKIEAEHTHS